MIRRLYFYDPAPASRQLRLPVLAVFGGCDDNILPAKNRAAWDAALKISGNRDYVLTILPGANHYRWQAKVGSNAEAPSLRGFVLAYFTTITNWLAARIRGFRPF